MKRFLRFRLSTILFLLFLICTVLGIYTFIAGRAKKQREAVEMLRNRSPKSDLQKLMQSIVESEPVVVYDYEQHEFEPYSTLQTAKLQAILDLKNSTIKKASSGEPSALASLIGIDMIHDVVHANLTLDEIPLLKNFPKLTSVNLSDRSGRALSQKDWDELMLNQSLRRLELECEHSLESKLEFSFSTLLNLEKLHVGDIAISDQFFDAIAQASNLKILSLVGPPSPNEFQENGLPIPQVEKLRFPAIESLGTDFTQFITRFVNLQKLIITGDANQQCLERIAALKKLRHLQISDFDKIDLTPLNELKSLRLLLIHREHNANDTLSLLNKISIGFVKKPKQSPEEKRKMKMIEEFRKQHPDCVVCY